MAIEFACPNDHRLSCSDDRAGTQGKCPKCGVAFQVPNASTLPPAGGPPPRNADQAADSGPGGQVVSGQQTADGDEELVVGKPAPAQIQFLCPNGHKLNGPISLQGQPGQCPHCGMKFRIPLMDEEDSGSSRIASMEDLEDSSEMESFEEGSDLEELEDVEEINEEDDDDEIYTAAEEGGQLASFLPPVVNEPDHSLARLFPMLWNEKHHGAVLEVHLGDGITLVPDWWSERLSLDDYVVFALQTADGTYVMETIPWDAIKRITVRRITELPGGVFD